MSDTQPTGNLRPWTHEEAIGKAIKFKTFDHSFLITHANEKAFSFSGYNYSPAEVLKHCVQVNGQPCGAIENE